MGREGEKRRCGKHGSVASCLHPGPGGPGSNPQPFVYGRDDAATRGAAQPGPRSPFGSSRSILLQLSPRSATLSLKPSSAVMYSVFSAESGSKPRTSWGAFCPAWHHSVLGRCALTTRVTFPSASQSAVPFVRVLVVPGPEHVPLPRTLPSSRLCNFCLFPV